MIDLSPNEFFLLLRVRKVYLMDSYLKNGISSKNQLCVEVENIVNPIRTYNPSKTTRDFISKLIAERVLFVQGSLKIDLDLCDSVIKSSKVYIDVKAFISEYYTMIGKGFFE